MDNNTVSLCADCIKERHCEYARPYKSVCNRKEEVKNMWEKIKKIAAKQLRPPKRCLLGAGPQLNARMALRFGWRA